MELFEYIKSYLEKTGCDYLYVNHTNEFFSEYVDIEKSSRYLLTKFSGSMGDAIVSKEKIYLPVDSRYWQQAEMETDKNIVEVIKLGKAPAVTFDEAVISFIKPNAKVLFYKDKTSFSLYEKFKKLGFKIKLTDIDLVQKYLEIKPANLKEEFKKIPISIAGRSSKNKISKIQNKLKGDEVLIVSSLEDVSYLLNLKSSIFEYSSVVFGKVIIEKDKYKFCTRDKDFENGIKALAKSADKKFLIDKQTLSVKYKKYFKNYESAKFLPTLRSKKYNAEINYMESCFERTDMVLKDVFNEFEKRDFTEIELYDFVNKKFRDFKAETNSFKTIVAGGKNSSIVHYSHPKNKKLREGELVLLDCGGFYEGGYATDITRTFLKGAPSKEQRVVYTLVLKAFLRAYNADLTKYQTCLEIDKVARDFLAKEAPKGFVFGHGLGHSVGRCVHDGLPTVSPSPLAKMKIKRNMVFTIEPGLYKPNWGGVRLENTVHVTKENGKLRLKSFSKAPFQKKLIDFSMLSDIEKRYLKEWELV